MAGGKGKRVIFPVHSDSQEFRFQVPPGARGPLVVTAEFNFRRYRQEFLDLVVPDLERESGVLQPTVRQSSAVIQMKIQGANEPVETASK